MFKKLGSFLKSNKDVPAQSSNVFLRPYKNPATDLIYNLLFCDDIELYRSNYHGEIIGHWKILFSKDPSRAALEAIAYDASIETRARILAYNALDKSRTIEVKEVLGIILEVGLPQGVDTLAAYKDFRARYINHNGKSIIWESRSQDIDEVIRKLFSTSQDVLSGIKALDHVRFAPPLDYSFRITLLVSDGVYLGQGKITDKDETPVLRLFVKAQDLFIALLKKDEEFKISEGYNNREIKCDNNDEFLTISGVKSEKSQQVKDSKNNAKIFKISVLRSGELRTDGKIISINEVESFLSKLDLKNVDVVEHKNKPKEPFPPQAMEASRKVHLLIINLIKAQHVKKT